MGALWLEAVFVGDVVDDVVHIVGSDVRVTSTNRKRFLLRTRVQELPLLVG